MILRTKNISAIWSCWLRLVCGLFRVTRNPVRDPTNGEVWPETEPE